MACIQFKSGLFNEKVIFEESKKICKILINLIKDVDIVLVLNAKAWNYRLFTNYNNVVVINQPYQDRLYMYYECLI